MVNINIPLPDSCASCPLSVRHFGKLYCPALNDRVGNEGKDSRCPLGGASENTCEIERKSNDLISRQDAIDALDCINGTEEVLRSLPSAQPDLSEYSDKLWRNAYERGKRDAQSDFDITVKIDKAYDDGYEAGYLQGQHDWGDFDE